MSKIQTERQQQSPEDRLSGMKSKFEGADEKKEVAQAKKEVAQDMTAAAKNKAANEIFIYRTVNKYIWGVYEWLRLKFQAKA